MTVKPEEEKNKDENEKEATSSETDTKFKCNPEEILEAISVIRQLNDKYYESCEKKPLLKDVSDNPVFLQISLKKIPGLKWRQCIKVPLPNPLVKDRTEVCLITGDLDKRNRKAEIEPDVLYYKELLKSQNITQISEVITLRQLRTEYKSYEARRNLCGAYDIFLCDKKIAGVMPNTLGKVFFQKRKIPIQISMERKTLKDTIDKILKHTVFHLTCRGNSCVLEVASLSMKDDEILNNITSSINILKDKLPGGVDNIMGLYVKTSLSKALPIYMSFDNPNEVIVKKRKFKKENIVEEEISTISNAKVKVFRSGTVIVKRMKHRKIPFNKSEKLKGKSSLVKRKSKGNKAVNKTDSENVAEINDIGGSEPTPRKKIKKERRNVDSDGNVNKNSKPDQPEINDLGNSKPSPRKKIKKEKNADSDRNVKQVHEREMNEETKPSRIADKKGKRVVTSNKNKFISKSTKGEKNLKAINGKRKKVKV